MAVERISYNRTPITESPKRVDKFYEQSKDELKGLPQTSLIPEQALKLNMPNIFTVKETPSIWLQDKGIPPRFVYAEKADDGGAGGHVESSARLQSAIADYVLRHNRWGNSRPIFTSLIVTHTGDDVGVTGIIDEKVMEHQEVAAELMWDAFKAGEKVAVEQGLYGPGQDLKADAFTGNVHGLGPATVILPLPVRAKNPSQVVVVGFADKTEPGAWNHVTRGAYLDPNFNTGLLIADSAMNKGYVFEIADLDTKAQALEEGVQAGNQKALDEAMERLGKTERYIHLKGPEDLYNIAALLMNGTRFVISKIYTKNDDSTPGQLGVIVSAERLHNIKTAKGFTYGGKDDPVMLSLAQGDWPAPGEISSPLARTPIVAGDCRGSHYLHVYPMPVNELTTYWSGPIMSMFNMSVNIHTGKIGAITDQFARGTPWDTFRDDAARKMKEFRDSQGYQQPGTLPTGEMEYQPGFNKRMGNLVFQRREVK